MTLFLLILAATIVIVALIMFIVFWTTHISQVREYTDKWGKGSYKTFIREFKKYEWERCDIHPKSFFCGSSDSSQVHADIIQFEGKGMILDPWSYLRFCIFINRNSHKKKSKQVEKW